MKNDTQNKIQIGAKANLTPGVKAEIILFALLIVADVLIIFFLPNPDEIVFSVHKDVVYIFLFFSIAMIILLVGRSIGRRNKNEKELNRYNRTNRIFLFILLGFIFAIAIISLVAPDIISNIFIGEFDLVAFLVTNGLLQFAGVGAGAATLIAIIVGALMAKS